MASPKQRHATSPERWRERAPERLASNREIEAVNRRLRDLELLLARLEPSLAEQRRELQRLQAHNAAEIAHLKGENAPKKAKNDVARRSLPFVVDNRRPNDRH